jgi:predicted RNA-binding Zn-ribbon protein involved in translation (DUF1610 family)
VTKEAIDEMKTLVCADCGHEMVPTRGKSPQKCDKCGSTKLKDKSVTEEDKNTYVCLTCGYRVYESEKPKHCCNCRNMSMMELVEDSQPLTGKRLFDSMIQEWVSTYRRKYLSKE